MHVPSSARSAQGMTAACWMAVPRRRSRPKLHQHAGSGPLVGTTFEPGTMTNGIKMSEVLDRECRSSSFQRPGMGRKPRTHEGDHGTSPGEFAPVP